VGVTGRPSTLGGPGWRARTDPHRAEVAAGLWGPGIGLCSEVAPLREVLLTAPGSELDYTEPPEVWLMDARPDLARLQAQASAVASAYEAAGVAVTWMVPRIRPPPNLLFARDLFFMTPEGAVLARMAARQRAGEERLAAEALALRGVPVLATPTGRATLEGADALWMDERTVLVGVGRRTNEAGHALLGRVLHDQGVQTVPVEVPDTSQHLLGALVPLSPGRALGLRATPSIRACVARLGWELVDMPIDEETTARRAGNLVVLGPGRVLMPDGCPRTRAWLERLGVGCEVVEVSEYVKAAGGLGCLTGILRRAS
jgi:N-dimethylarginine dimethylaminohydrolase